MKVSQKTLDILLKAKHEGRLQPRYQQMTDEQYLTWAQSFAEAYSRGAKCRA